MRSFVRGCYMFYKTINKLLSVYIRYIGVCGLPKPPN